MKKLNIVLALAAGLLAMSCANNSKPKIDGDVDLGKLDFNNELNRAKQVFYALPSPVETAHLIQSTGVSYNMDLANPTTNVDKYTTTAQKALNFGVYGADLSYASLFNQTQTAIQYIATAKKLADELGIFDFVQPDVANRIENNINDRDSLMEIITEGFTNANEYLNDAGRAEVAALIVAGGWIESLYLSTELAEMASNNTRLIDLVIDQRYSLSILVKMLETYKELSSVSEVYGWLADLQKTFDRVKSMPSEVKAETSKDGKTTLASSNDTFINEVLFSAICQKTDSIRTAVVK